VQQKGEDKITSSDFIIYLLNSSTDFDAVYNVHSINFFCIRDLLTVIIQVYFAENKENKMAEKLELPIFSDVVLIVSLISA
jgi:hypothetical protein